MTHAPPTLEQIAERKCFCCDTYHVLAREIIALREWRDSMRRVLNELQGAVGALESAPARGEAPRMVNIYERYVEIRAERDTLQQQLADARAALAEIARNSSATTNSWVGALQRIRDIARDALASPDADGGS